MYFSSELQLLGDFVILSNAGTVNVDKLRGEKIVISCPESKITLHMLSEILLCYHVVLLFKP